MDAPDVGFFSLTAPHTHTLSLSPSATCVVIVVSVAAHTLAHMTCTQ